MDLGFWKRALDSRNTMSSMAKPDACFELSLSNPRVSEPGSNHFHLLQNTGNYNGKNIFHSFQQNLYQHHLQENHLHHHQNPLFQQQQQQQGPSQELGFLRPIRGIPVYQNPTPFSVSQQPLDSTGAQNSSLATTNSSSSSLSPYQSPGFMRSRLMSRFPAKRSMRAPRMRWTTTLHARFVHAMYRTVKTTDQAAAASGQSDGFDNASSGDTSEDLMFDIQNSRSELSMQQGRPSGHQDNKNFDGLWSNSSSREAWLHVKPKDSDGNVQSLKQQKGMDPKCLSCERKSDVSSSTLSGTSPKKPNLEFTLGRPH
ncbi:hypothetical protein GH714_041155 [Hevea brasiliensis]|uniref:Uncharacterized protein n=1 Tax=Hevea brasiliensis TaxID=3981 RepID=A0A6A6MVA5_HEVBR|nr:hypothetical protein GH714_041155 [Hevea brasiliensis]